MVRMTKYIVSAVLIALFGGGIAHADQSISKNKQISATNNLPQWATEPEFGIEDGIAAVGLSPYLPDAGMDMMRDMAETDAQAKLAEQVKLEIAEEKKSIKSFEFINGNKKIKRVFDKSIDAAVDKITLSGAKVNGVYQAKDGTLYVRMVIERKKVAHRLKAEAAPLKSELKKSGASKSDIKKALAALDQVQKKIQVPKTRAKN